MMECFKVEKFLNEMKLVIPSNVMVDDSRIANMHYSVFKSMLETNTKGNSSLLLDVMYEFTKLTRHPIRFNEAALVRGANITKSRIIFTASLSYRDNGEQLARLLNDSISFDGFKALWSAAISKALQSHASKVVVRRFLA